MRFLFSFVKHNITGDICFENKPPFTIKFKYLHCCKYANIFKE